MSELAEKRILENIQTQNPDLYLEGCNLEGTESILENYAICCVLRKL